MATNPLYEGQKFFMDPKLKSWMKPRRNASGAARRAPLGACLLAGLLAAAPLRAETVQLPDMGEHASSVISAEQQRRIGESVMRQIRESGDLLEDTEANTYINALGYRLIAHGAQTHQRFTFFIVKDPAINAFALPGGFIGVNTGLIAATRNESELASVLAHEIAHVIQNHLARGFEKAQQMNLPLTAAVIAAILLGAHDPQVGEAALAASAAGSQQMQLDFTRANEEEADRVGMQLLAHSDFDPRSMPEFFQRLQQESRYYASGLPEFLRTHPVTAHRIADTLNRAEQYPAKKAPKDPNYALIKAKLQVEQSRDPAALARRLEKELQSHSCRNEAATRYGYGLALDAAGNTAGAERELGRLYKEEPDRIAYALALGSVRADAGKYPKAIEVYRKSLALYPDNAPLTVALCEALLGANRAQDAKDTITALIRGSDDAPANTYQVLAKAESKLGNSTAAHIALAESYRRLGDPANAIAQLEIAKRKKDLDFYDTSRIEAMLGELRTELKKTQ
jgi:predicted Zn-dependent protease